MHAVIVHHTHTEFYICLLFPEPRPPTDISFTVTGSDSAVASWMASQSLCDDVIGNYSVRYQLKSACNNYTTVYTTETSVVLRGLVPNAEYTVSVAAINSMGDMSAFSPFVPPTPMVTSAVTSTQGKTHCINNLCCLSLSSVTILYFLNYFLDFSG